MSCPSAHVRPCARVEKTCLYAGSVWSLSMPQAFP
ncbi:unnamed protein product, partial [Staurois parvus]